MMVCFKGRDAKRCGRNGTGSTNSLVSEMHAACSDRIASVLHAQHRHEMRTQTKARRARMEFLKDEQSLRHFGRLHDSRRVGCSRTRCRKMMGSKDGPRGPPTMTPLPCGKTLIPTPLKTSSLIS